LREILHKVYNKVGIKSQRTKGITKHVLLSFIYKGGSIMATFLLVPLTIDFLDTDNYGVWLTLSSFISWFAFFDIGLGNGLRNKFAEARAQGNEELAQAYVSSAYFTIGIISLLLIGVFLILNFFIDWTLVFNTDASMQSDLSVLMPIVFSFFFLQLIVKLITTIYTADQKPSIQGKIGFITQVGALFLIWVLIKTSETSLLTFGVVFSALPVFILLFFNLIAFSKPYKNYKPIFSLWKLEYLKDIFGVGFSFFIIQIAALILFSTDNFIISKLFSPADVVPYNISYKYFSIIIMVYSIIVTPYWSSFTEAYVRKDYDWIKSSVKNIMKIWMFIPIILIFMVLFANLFYLFWVGDKVVVPLLLNISMALYVLIITFNMVFVSFINGLGKIRVQLITSIILIVINIPLSILFASNFKLGVSGVILASCVCLISSAILFPIQYHKIINNAAAGIWNK
jgi:O-antigen/teichoic acid export membrane protein